MFITYIKSQDDVSHKITQYSGYVCSYLHINSCASSFSQRILGYFLSEQCYGKRIPDFLHCVILLSCLNPVIISLLIRFFLCVFLFFKCLVIDSSRFNCLFSYFVYIHNYVILNTGYFDVFLSGVTIL